MKQILKAWLADWLSVVQVKWVVKMSNPECRQQPSSLPLLQDKYNTQASSPASHGAVRTLYQPCSAFSSEQ